MPFATLLLEVETDSPVSSNIPLFRHVKVWCSVIENTVTVHYGWVMFTSAINCTHQVFPKNEATHSINAEKGDSKAQKDWEIRPLSLKR